MKPFVVFITTVCTITWEKFNMGLAEMQFQGYPSSQCIIILKHGCYDFSVVVSTIASKKILWHINKLFTCFFFSGFNVLVNSLSLTSTRICGSFRHLLLTLLRKPHHLVWDKYRVPTLNWSIALMKFSGKPSFRCREGQNIFSGSTSRLWPQLIKPSRCISWTCQPILSHIVHCISSAVQQVQKSHVLCVVTLKDQ